MGSQVGNEGDVFALQRENKVLRAIVRHAIVHELSGMVTSADKVREAIKELSIRVGLPTADVDQVVRPILAEHFASLTDFPPAEDSSPSRRLRRVTGKPGSVFTDQ